MIFENLPRGMDAVVDDRILAFGVFAEERSFTRAAERLHLTQSALNRKIQRLETQLDGMRLWIKDPQSNRVLGLTAEGEELAEYARQVSTLARDLLVKIRSREERPLSIAAGRGSFLFVIPDRMRALSARPGGVRAIVSKNEEALELIDQGRADLAVLGRIDPPAGVMSRLLDVFQPTLVLADDHPLATRSVATVADFDGLKFALPGRGHQMRDELEEMCRRSGAAIRVVAEAVEWDMLLQHVRFGVEATLVNGFMPIPPGLIGVPVNDLPSVRYHAVWRTERSASAQEFLEPEMR
jgi:DNA-binding transcriptional LysR family regulator